MSDTGNQWNQIFDRIGEAAAWEMLAEESAELAAAASKIARIVRGENPSRTEYDAAVKQVVDELADVRNSTDVLDSGIHHEQGNLCVQAWKIQPQKMTRWYHSLFGEEAT